MTYRKLEKDEWDRLKPIFEVEEWPLPSRELAAVAIAEDDEGRIHGLLVMEFKLHAEPLWIRDESKGQVTFRGLARVMAAEALRIAPSLPENAAVYFLTSQENVGKLAEPLGFQPLDEKVWRLEVR